jgi:hypothetical protein
VSNQPAGPAGSTVVATANVQCTLGAAQAGAALATVLAHQPDLVALQEWGLARRRLLDSDGYDWSAPLIGGCVVGYRRDRYRLRRRRTVRLSAAGRADNPGQRLGLEPFRVATAALLDDLETGRPVAMISFHCTPGVQAGAAYRVDRPRLVARHRAEVARLTRLVAELGVAGHVVHAAGDSNFHGLRIDGLTSCWSGHESMPGTWGERRRIDDVFGPGQAARVELVSTPSDHRAVVVTRPDG